MLGRVRAIFTSLRMDTRVDATPPVPLKRPPMAKIPQRMATGHSRSRVCLSPSAVLLLAVALGMCAGYLDLGIMLLKKFYVNPEGYFRGARDSAWSVPVAHAILMLIPGLILAAATRLRPEPMSLRLGSWLLATLAFWSALLRIPIRGESSLLLAAGLGRLCSDVIVASGLSPRRVRRGLAAIFGLLGVLVALSSGLQAVREYRETAVLRPPPAGARNLILIVWDTVRSYDLSLYGYEKNTAPNLTRWARQGVVYRRAVAPAPWTFPSHTCFFTGQWPFLNNSQWKSTLESAAPTLAEYLASRGYQTAGFAANTNHCTYESGLGRGFTHYEDYALGPRLLLARTVVGSLLGKYVLYWGDYYAKKWIELQSRGAHEINSAFLDWLGRRRTDRPFFAYLNYFDAHDPYVPPPEYAQRFGIGPVVPWDYRFLFEYIGIPKQYLKKQYFRLARDSYDDCIAYLDEHLGRLLDDLQRRGLLDSTDVIITSDHGEGFGEHSIYGHSYGVNLDETGVPLVILSRKAPAGRVVESGVSLRDLPATVVEMLGLSAGSPFPGRSLTAHWGVPPEQAPAEITSPVYSERVDAIALRSRPGGGCQPDEFGWQMSLLAFGRHYIRNGQGVEQLYDLTKDPMERTNLVDSGLANRQVEVFRRMLLDFLSERPGTPEVEGAYLAPFRERLHALVKQSSLHSVASGP
jgi:arylsulfatase A-like enzyme